MVTAEPWRAEQVKALHLLGPDYRSTFSPTESSAVLEQARRAVRSPRLP